MSVFDVNGTPVLQATRAFGGLRSVRRPDARSLSRGILDLALLVALMPILALAAAILVIVNPFANPGPLFYRQTRMGEGGRPFEALKFRTMLCAPAITRGAFDGVEVNRITPLGHVLRRTRIDELPQMINVLFGEMSFIGPRPDYYDHAAVYLMTVPGYRRRLSMRPGISGYAQTRVGYVDGAAGVRRKVAADLVYRRHASLRFDL